MNKTTYPSFGHMLELGATTLWERFEKRDSGNHPMFGTYTSWFVKTLAGINTDKNSPGYRNVIIKPVPPNDLDYVFCKIENMAGEAVKSEWKRHGDMIDFIILYPANSTLNFTIAYSGIPYHLASAVAAIHISGKD